MSMVYAFEDFVLDTSSFALRRGEEPVAVQPKALDVLIYLVTHRERVVSKQELLAELWPDATVNEPALSQAVLLLRRAVADDGDGQRIIRTVRGRGYRFVAPLRETVSSPAPASPPPGNTATVDTLVGRESTMALLGARLDAAVAGRGGTMLVAGEAGTGKTRVLEALAAAARARGVTVLVGRAFDDPGQPRFWMWTQALRGYLDEHPDGLDPAWSSRLDEYGVSNEVTQLLKRASTAQPLLVALDDVHRADAASLLLLRFCASAFDAARVLVVASFRESALTGDPAIARTIGALRRENPAAYVELRGLDPGGTESLVRAILGRAPEPALVARLHAKTAGNPLFLTQLTHLLAASEPTAEDGMSTSAMLDAESLRQAVRLQVEGLPAECVRVLRAVSVLGSELPVGPAAQVLGCTPAAFFEAMDEAFRARLIVRRSSGTFAFRHVLVRDALYVDLLPSERTRLHAKAAQVLLAHHGEPTGAHLADVARHFVRGAAAGHVAAAVLWSIRAARWQIGAGAAAEADDSLAGAALALDLAATESPGDLAVAERELAELVAQEGAPPRARELQARLKSRARSS